LAAACDRLDYPNRWASRLRGPLRPWQLPQTRRVPAGQRTAQRSRRPAARVATTPSTASAV